MRSYKSYIIKFVIGAEALYFLCLLYGYALTDQAVMSHRQMYAMTAPGMTWGGATAVIWGAVIWGIASALIAWYLTWAHNSSLEKSK